MIKNLLFLFLLISCSANQDRWKRFNKEPLYQQKVIPVSSAEEAYKVIQNKVNFTKMIFEQSKDPYFGTNRWSNYCLKINKVGSVVRLKNGIQVTSTLILNKDGDPGFCHDSPDEKTFFVVYVFCDGMNDVVEMKFPSSSKLENDLDNLCN